MEFNIVNDQEFISFAGGVSVLAICQRLVHYVAFVIQSVNVQSCGQEVVWSVAFFVSVGQCPGRVLAFVQHWCSPQRLKSYGRGSPGADFFQRYLSIYLYLYIFIYIFLFIYRLFMLIVVIFIQYFCSFQRATRENTFIVIGVTLFK